MKKGLRCVLVAMLAVMILFASCSNETAIDEVAMVSLDAVQETTRGIAPDPQVLDPDEWYWWYKAVKIDDTGFDTGSTPEFVRVDPGDYHHKGLHKSVGPFSIGEWKITLRANSTYDDPDKKIAYEGDVNVFIGSGMNKISVIVANANVNQTGTLRIDKDCILVDNGKEVMPPVNVDRSCTVYNEQGEVVRTFTGISTTLAPGNYEVLVQYVHSAKPDEVLASARTAFTIYPSVTTNISGTLIENNKSVDVEAAFAVKNASATVTAQSGADTKIEVNAAPQPSEEVNNKTLITVPADSGLKAGDANVAITTYASKAANEKPEFKVAAGEVALGGIDIDITQGPNNEKVTTFSKPITITTYIAPGFEPEEVTVACTSGGTDPTSHTYNKETGELQFTTDHLSSFCVKLTGYDAYNVTRDYYIKDFFDMFKSEVKNSVGKKVNNPNYSKWFKGDEIKLLRDITANDSTGSIYLIRKTVTIDLNGHQLIGDFATKDNVLSQTYGTTLTIKNSKSEGGIVLNSNTTELDVMDYTCILNLDGIKITTASPIVTLDPIHPDNATVNVINGTVIDASTLPATKGLFINSIEAKETQLHLTIDSSTINCGGTIFLNNGNNVLDSDSITIKGNSVITGKVAYLPAGCAVDISGGKFTATDNIIYQKAGSLTISGGEFTTTGSDSAWSYNGNGANLTSDGFVLEACNYGGNGDPSVNITGGTFTNANNRYGVVVLNHTDDWNGKTEAHNVTVTAIPETWTHAKFTVDTKTPKDLTAENVAK